MTRIGFIGVGTMGLPMAKNLVAKGFAVTAFDTNPDAVKAAAAAGARAAGSTAEAVAGAPWASGSCSPCSSWRSRDGV